MLEEHMEANDNLTLVLVKDNVIESSEILNLKREGDGKDQGFLKEDVFFFYSYQNPGEGGVLFVEMGVMRTFVGIKIKLILIKF